ncbi:MAG: glycosyltransferase family 4 protein, partial [Chloroflexota bacterium]
MRILFVTNFYPPHGLGGQAHSCRQVVEGLQQRGHRTLVLTSRHGVASDTGIGGPETANGVWRTLYLEMELAPWRHALAFFTARKHREEHNLQSVRRCLQAFEPHVVFVWGMWNLPRSLPATIEQLAGPQTLYRFADYWPTLPSQHQLYWQQPGRRWASRLARKAVAPIALSMLAREQGEVRLRFDNAYCVSAATRQALVQSGVPVEHARVIHTGLDLEPFLSANGSGPRGAEQPDVKILYAGRLEETKGVDTLISAMAKLFAREMSPAHLRIAGSGSQRYEQQLRDLVSRRGLTHSVTFLGQVPAEEMVALLHDAHIVVAPSRWPEPLARIVLEAMAARTAVIASRAGGTPEMIEDGYNGLLFDPDNSDELAEKLEQLIARPQWRAELAGCGRQTVMQRFTVDRMLDEIELYLQEIAATRHPE